jgi:hypothetical protein
MCLEACLKSGSVHVQVSYDVFPPAQPPFPLPLLLFITAVPNTKLCAWGEEDSGEHVL